MKQHSFSKHAFLIFENIIIIYDREKNKKAVCYSKKIDISPHILDWTYI